MKILSLFLFLISAAVSQASIMSFSFTATLVGGDYFKGTFDGLVEENEIKEVFPGEVEYYNQARKLVYSSDFWEGSEKVSGPQSGVFISWTRYTHINSVTFFLGGNYAHIFIDDSGDYTGYGGALAEDGWKFKGIPTPESPATLSLLSLGLLGIAGVKRRLRK